jgi:type I restriction enzyme S subunit
MSSTTRRRGWQDGKLEDLVFFQRGFDITQEQQREGSYPVISSSGVTSYHDEFKVSGPGVVIGRKGTIGSIHFTTANYWPHDTTLWSKDLKGNNPRFVYYFLHTLDFKRFDVGNSNPTLNRNHIHDLAVSIPPPSVQDDIADVLSAYDELMANNRRRIELLEEAARLLYREWFVCLRFPGHEHTRLNNGIPESWERKPLGEYSSFLKRGIAPHYDDDAAGLVINQKCIRNGRLNLNLARHQSREFAPERQVEVGDVLVNSTGEGTLGRIAQLKSHVDNCTVDTHVTIVRPKPGIPIHYFGMAVMAWESQFSTMGRGATNQTELSPGQIGESPILIPNETLLEEFESFADPIYQQVTNLVSQNDKLRAARDLLLPCLMSGEISV